MSQQFRPALETGTMPQGGPVAREEGFDYMPLEKHVARRVRSSARRIRRTMRRTLEVLIAVGEELLAVKEALPHGSFGPWLRAEFGWTERTAQNFMTVAERFGPKNEIISDLRIEPTAAYLLAAPSAPEEASEVAVRRAKGGERVTASVAREILSALRKKRVRPRRTATEPPAEKLLGQLLECLESFRRRWEPRKVPMLARELREFADSLEGG